MNEYMSCVDMLHWQARRDGACTNGRAASPPVCYHVDVDSLAAAVEGKPCGSAVQSGAALLCRILSRYLQGALPTRSLQLQEACNSLPPSRPGREPPLVLATTCALAIDAIDAATATCATVYTASMRRGFRDEVVLLVGYDGQQEHTER